MAIAEVGNQGRDDLQSEPEITLERHFVEQPVAEEPAIVAICVVSWLPGYGRCWMGQRPLQNGRLWRWLRVDIQGLEKALGVLGTRSSTL